MDITLHNPFFRFDPALKWLKVTHTETIILSDKIDCTLRFGNIFSEGSPSLPSQQGTGQQGRCTGLG